MAGVASSREPGCRVIRVVCPLEVFQVATCACRRQAGKLPVDMALAARYVHVRARQRERCLGMVELRTRP